MLQRRECLLGAAGMAALGRACLAAPEEEVVLAALKQTVGSRARSAGMIAVIVDDGGTQLTAYGSSGASGVTMDDAAVFQIMSITKVLTSLLLAEMAGRGEVALDDPVAKYLPLALHARGRPITLLDLATYTSGLPNMPGNVPPDWYARPDGIGDYTQAKLFEFLSDYVPEHEPGTHYEYCNLGFGLLAIALARRAGMNYEKLLIERVCDPLGLGHTRITLTGDMRTHLVQGHDLDLKPIPLWNFGVLQGAGTVCASVRDLTVFLKACMGLAHTPLAAPLARLVESRKPTSLAGTEAGMGWFVTSDGGEQIVWKSGLSGGSNTFIGYAPQKRRGVVLLSNFLWQPIDAGTIDMGVKMIKPDARPVDFNALYPHG